MRSEKNENSKSNVNEERTESFHAQMRKKQNKTKQKIHIEFVGRRSLRFHLLIGQ
jgi:hypothetical protein